MCSPIRAITAGKQRSAARFTAETMTRNGEGDWRVVTVLLDKGRLKHYDAEHEFVHAVHEFAVYLRERKLLRAKRSRGKHQVDAWWDEWMAQSFSNVARVWQLWLKYGKDADKIPGRLIPRDIFPTDI